MNTTPNDTLTAEERELAQLMGRAGPQGAPSPALDARILGAAHAAVAGRPTRKPRSRWPVALGLAASAVLAVGIAWQLRPVQQTAALHEAPVAYSRMEPVPPASPASDAMPATGHSADAAPEAVTAEASGNVAAAPAAEAAPAPMPVQKPRSAPMPARMQQPTPVAQAPATEAPRIPRDPADDRYSTRTRMAPPPPPASPAPVASMASAPSAESLPGFVPDAAADASVRHESAGLQGFTRASNATAAKQSTPRDEAKADAAREAESQTLDRVEVTGSRLKRTDLQVPVSEDAQLAVEEWLERVRTRYGLGDAGAAKRSLLLFVKDHPGEPIPGDLEPLLEK